MNILALDTSTEACSAALLRADGLVFSEFEMAPRQHNRLLPRMMDRVLAEAGVGRTELSHCAFANGPGAFTGIRIAAAQAQGIGMALDIPLLPLSTLAVMAQASLDAFSSRVTLVALDARMDEVYWAIYQRDAGGLARLRGEERLGSLDSVVVDADVECGAGHGWLPALSAKVGFPVDAALLPDAAAMLPLARDAVAAGAGVRAERAGINYLRNRVAEKSAR